VSSVSDRVKFFNDFCELMNDLKYRGVEFMVTCFHRTPEEQSRLVKEGKSLTLNSKHLEWLAIDVVLVKNGGLVWKRCEEYDLAGSLWEGMGHTWGGRWESLEDIYHFEF
jgi:peptidoglycan L-alanyl-D-glutamate endopeptidase CwlK